MGSDEARAVGRQGRGRRKVLGGRGRGDAQRSGRMRQHRLPVRPAIRTVGVPRCVRRGETAVHDHDMARASGRADHRGELRGACGAGQQGRRERLDDEDEQDEQRQPAPRAQGMRATTRGRLGIIVSGLRGLSSMADRAARDQPGGVGRDMPSTTGNSNMSRHMGHVQFWMACHHIFGPTAVRSEKPSVGTPNTVTYAAADASASSPPHARPSRRPPARPRRPGRPATRTARRA